MIAPTEFVKRERERVRKWRAQKSAAGRDIGQLPAIKNPTRRRAAGKSFRLFCLTYLAHAFTKPFSDDHHKVIATMEKAVKNGGLFALAMPRGSGKTTLCEAVALWAILYGFHRFVVLIGATGSAAKQMLDSIKTELATNELLLEDFPEVCFPIHALEGITNRASGQRFNGQPTHIGWKGTELVLPTIPDSPASGAILQVAGITAGSIRGKKKQIRGKRRQVARPTLAIVDDPQTDSSAVSAKQCNSREETINGAVLGMAGPGKKIAGLMPCTVIAQGDLADRFLDRDRYPEWNGIRTKTLYAFPTNWKLWEQYAEIRADSLRKGNEGREATTFYKKNRAAMDFGAIVAWESRYRDDELSALQSAMNLYFRNRAAFAAEYQNEPVRRDTSVEVKILTAAEIAEKVNGCPRGELPPEVSVLTAFVDVQQDILFWVVCGWSQDFDGFVVDYGTWPDQGRAYFTLSDLRVTIGDQFPDIKDLEGRLYAACKALTDDLVAREFERADGVHMRLRRELIDANWGLSTKTVKRFCRQSQHAALLLPSHGRFVGATSKPISQFQKKPGEQYGDEWLISRVANERGIRHIVFDTNYWKSFIHARLAIPMGSRGGLSLFGSSPAEHRMFADHQVAEGVTRVKAKGREVDEWKEKPARPDNHWFDCLVGCAVAASVEGCAPLKQTIDETPPRPPRRPRKRVSYPI